MPKLASTPEPKTALSPETGPKAARAASSKIEAPDSVAKRKLFDEREHLDCVDSCDAILQLRGERRSADEIHLVAMGAKHALSENVDIGPIPKENTQEANDAWVKANCPEGVIKLRGKGRTKNVIREEMELFHLGAVHAPIAAVKLLDPFLTAPEPTQAENDAWMNEHLDGVEGCDVIQRLRGEGRTADAINSDIHFVIAGGKHALSKNAATGPIPKENTQEANDAWVKANCPEGVIKLRGESRTKNVVRKEMELFHLGAVHAPIAAAQLIGKLLMAPEPTQAERDPYVNRHLDGVDLCETTAPRSARAEACVNEELDGVEGCYTNVPRSARADSGRRAP